MYLGPNIVIASSPVIRINHSLSKEASASVRNWYSVFGLNVELLLCCPQLLFKLVNVGHLHAVHKGQPLQTEATASVLEYCK